MSLCPYEAPDYMLFVEFLLPLLLLIRVITLGYLS